MLKIVDLPFGYAQEKSRLLLLLKKQIKITKFALNYL
jgi:hypothetical protein